MAYYTGRYPANLGAAEGEYDSTAAEWVRDKWAAFVDWGRKIIDLQHRAALAAQQYRAQGDPEGAAAAKAMISTLGELNQLHNALVYRAETLLPYIGLGAIAVPVAVATGFSALAVAMLWFLRKAALQESLLEALESGALTEAGYIEANRALDENKDPLTASLTAGANLGKWVALAFLGWIAFQALGMAKEFRANPPLAIFHPNPPGVMSERVYHLAYRHAEDGENYIHEFGPDVIMEAQEDGSIAVYHRNGRPVWRDFEVSH